MQPAVLILLVGVLVLGCGSLGLLLVRLASPELRGTSWLSLAFAAGSLGAGLLLVRHIPLLEVEAADACLLSSFILLHVAVLRVLERDSVPLTRGVFPLLIQALVDALCLTGHTAMYLRVISLSLLVAMQSAVTAIVLWRSTRKGVRAPSVFVAVLLLGFGLFNLGRGIETAFGQGYHLLNRQLSLVAFSLYIAVALGLAFGFFWMTTATLTAEVEDIASTDPLTRLFNRRVFLRWCERELARSYRSGAPFSLLMVDLDHFKRINDTFGHPVGDEVLCAAVEKMQDSVRGIDVLCRWGGEEFAVLLPNASAEATRIVAERIRENVLKTQLSPEIPDSLRRGFQLTTSIGTATYHDLDDGIAAMFQRADKALYEAKRSGRNCVLVTA